MSVFRGLKSRWDRFFFDGYTAEDFVVFRFLIFSYLAVISPMFLDETVTTRTQEMWHPISFFHWIPLETLVPLLLPFAILLKIAAALAAIGICYRYMSKLAFISALIVLGYPSNFGKVFHGYSLLVMTIGLCSLVQPRFKRSCVDSQLKFQDFWSIQLLKIYIVMIYFDAGFGKLDSTGGEWVFSENFYRAIVQSPGKGFWGEQILNLPVEVSIVLAGTAVFLTQLSSPVVLFWKYGGVLFFALAASFHLGVHFIFGGHYGFLSNIICLGVLLPCGRLLKWNDGTSTFFRMGLR